MRFIKSSCIKKHIMSRRLIEIFLLILLFGCSSKSPTLHDSFKGHSLTKFCDLPKYEGKEIFTRAYYIGSQEYWSLFSPDSCNNGYGVNLEFKDDNTTSKFQADLKKAIYNERSEGYTLIEAVGIFEKGRQGGYGHLGSNNSRFIVTELVAVQKIKFVR